MRRIEDIYAGLLTLAYSAATIVILLDIFVWATP